MASHDAILGRAIQAHGGYWVKSTGDGGHVAFSRAGDALRAAIDAQRAFQAEGWTGEGDAAGVRLGVHTGQAEQRDGDYYGSEVNRAARVMSIAYPGQALISAAVAALVEDNLPAGVALVDLGEQRLKGLTRPERVYQVAAAGLRADFPPLRTGRAFVSNLPAQRTPFVGREPEVSQIVSRLLDPSVRLLSLIGPGGTGKTRLALRVAGLLAQEIETGGPPHEGGRVFTDGIFFVPLAPVASAALMPAAVAESLGFRFEGSGDPRQQLLDHLRPKEALLIFDNLEQLVDQGGAALAAEILSAAPGIVILATSRTRLNVQGENVYPVAGMPAPDPAAVRGWRDVRTEAVRYPALQLFEQSAARVAAGFRLAPSNVEAVARITQLVQGMPLAIELAASWLEALPLSEIAAEIERSLDFLESSWQDAPPRQRSLRAVFETSWQYLTQAERDVLPALSLFRGGFSREAAAEVSGASPRALLGLVNKSWLQQAAGGRFAMHELLRQYAEERLSAEPAEHERIRERHAAYYARWLAGAVEPLRGVQQAAVAATIAADYDNIRLAWGHLVGRGDFETLTGPMLVALWYQALIQAREEALRPLLLAAETRRATETSARPDRVQAILKGARAWMHGYVYLSPGNLPESADAFGHYAGMDEATRQALGLWETALVWTYGWQYDAGASIAALRAAAARPGSPPTGWELALRQKALGQLLTSHGTSAAERQEGIDFLLVALPAYQRMGDAFGAAEAMAILTTAYVAIKAYDAAAEQLAAWQALADRAGGRRTTGTILLQQAEIALQRHDLAATFEFFREAQAVFRDDGDWKSLVHSLHWELIHAGRYGDLDHARQISTDLQWALSQANDINMGGWNHFEAGELSRLAGDYAAARAAYELARGVFESRGSLDGIGFYHRGRADIALAEGDFASAQEEYGRYLDASRTAAMYWSQAYALAGLGRASVGLGELERARDTLLESLRIADEQGNTDLCYWPLVGLAERALADGRAATAVELAAHVCAAPLAWNEMKAVAARLLERARGALPAGDVEEAEARGRATPLAVYSAEPDRMER